MYSKSQFYALEVMCRERARLADSESNYWLAEAEEWERCRQSCNQRPSSSSEPSRGKHKMSRSAISKFSWEMVLKKVTSWAFIAFVGSLAFLVLFIKDWEIEAGTDRLSKMYPSPQSVLDADPDLKLALRAQPLVRTERC
jgi:hypothetical protein